MLSENLLISLRDYLDSLYKTSVHIVSAEEIGKEMRQLKSFGYGKPYKITYEIEGEMKSAVLETMSANSFGHDHFSDRAQILLWSHTTYNKLPRHVRSLDSGAFAQDHRMISLGNAEEFFLLVEFSEGKEYAADLFRIHTTDKLLPVDLERAAALAQYLAEIHRTKLNAPHLYRRRIRDLLGHGECIMGLNDNYPDDDLIATKDRLQQIELQCVAWRWKIRGYTGRLAQVHGDFHPWNILFREGTDFTVLDRSRGEWGEPADDVGSMMINYIFMALRKEGCLQGSFERIYSKFWETYLSESCDEKILGVIQPFLAWRGLVLGNPVWYPDLPGEIRSKIFRFIENVLATDRFDPSQVNKYLT